MIIKWHPLLIRSPVRAGENKSSASPGAGRADAFFPVEHNLFSPVCCRGPGRKGGFYTMWKAFDSVLKNRVNALRNSSLFIPANAEDRHYL